MIVDLIRHGQVPGNLEKRYVGSTDESLTMDGVRVAKEKCYESPEHIFVSPRRRCIETAKLLYPDCDFTVIEELAECDFGSFEYKNYKELSGDPDYQAWIDSGATIGFPGGEDRDTFIQRCMQGWEKVHAISAARGYEHIGLVVHGGTIMAILDQTSEPHQDYFTWQCGNLEGYRCTIKSYKFTDIVKM